MLLLTGCEDNPDKPNSIFLGGQINNPETDYIVVSKENEIIDTLYLNKKNQFSKDFQNLESGIYTFKHPPESQIMYMEPGDSIIIWLNTMAFDESLNFSGDGAEESNFLLDMFLNNQKNNDFILTYYKIEPEKFAKLTDSIRNERIENLNRLKENEKFSEDFLKIAEASIDYEYYDLRERYTFLIKKYYRNFANKIPEDFNDYRDQIDFNNERLQEYYIYTNFLDDYLRSRSIEMCENRERSERKNCYDLNSFGNLQRRIVLADSLIKLKPLKNEFLDRLVNQSIIMAENEYRIDSILQLLNKIDYSKIEHAEKLSEIQKSYFVGASVNDKPVLNTNGESITYSEIIDSPTINLSWSIYAAAHHRWLHDIVQKLRKKYPEITFNMINIDGGNFENWLRVIESFGYDKDFQYQITKRPVSNDMYTYYLTKVIFVNEEGTIVKGDISYNTLSDFEEDIKEFQKLSK